MKPLGAVVLVVFVLPGLGAAQGNSAPATLSPNESDWLPRHVLSGPAHALGAPFRALGKLIRRAPAKPTTPTTPSEAQPESTGLIVFAQVQGQSTPLGLVTTVDVDVGYHLTPHFAADVGLPLYFVRGPYSIVTNHDWRYFTLWSDPYVDVRYTTTHSGVSLTSILTGTAPIANSAKIYSTGRAGVDWFNHIEGTLKGVTPFLNLGAANQTVGRYIMPRPYSVGRPYYSLGFVTDFEGGASYKFRRVYEIGASFYALVPIGPQKIYSRLIAPDSSVVRDANHNRYFANAYETIEHSGAARDNGFSGWLQLGHWQHVSLQLGYTRSVHFSYDALSLALHVDISPLFRAPKPKE